MKGVIMKRKVTSISLPIELHGRIQKKAKEEGTSPSELIRASMEIYLALDPMLMKSASRLAAGLNMAPIEVIQRFAIRTFAEDQASREILGIGIEGLRNLFIWESEHVDDDQMDLVNGDNLYWNLKKMFMKKFLHKLELKAPRLAKWQKRSAERKEDLKKDKD